MSKKIHADSPEYLKKKAFFEKVLTIYGRNSVLEALRDENINIYRLHMSLTNKSSPIVNEIEETARKRNIEILHHDRKSLSRISKNSKQDQGVALDIVLDHFAPAGNFTTANTEYRIIALDGVTNPQNLGMIIRSCAAGNIDALLLPEKGAAQISPLVIKSSVGAVFRMRIIKTEDLRRSLLDFKKDGAVLYSLSSHARESYKARIYGKKTIFILGNESRGVSPEIDRLCDTKISIPMRRGIESLNVAAAATLLAFLE